jgi:hypothetical protein
MRSFNITAAALLVGVVLSGPGFAAATQASRPGAVPAKPAVSVSTDADCEKTGSDVSALIDASAMSPNISAARAVFQVGIMNCMEGRSDEANKQYQSARKLLGSDQPKPTIVSPRS